MCVSHPTERAAGVAWWLRPSGDGSLECVRLDYVAWGYTLDPIFKEEQQKHQPEHCLVPRGGVTLRISSERGFGTIAALLTRHSPQLKPPNAIQWVTTGTSHTMEYYSARRDNEV